MKPRLTIKELIHLLLKYEMIDGASIDDPELEDEYETITRCVNLLHDLREFKTD